METYDYMEQHQLTKRTINVRREQTLEDKSNDIRMHYEKAAKNRDHRLVASTFNTAKENQRIRERLIGPLIRRHGKAEHAIDFGTGTGVWAEILAKYSSKVEGVDFAENNLTIAERNAEARNLADRVSYYQEDAQNLEGLRDNTYDIATHISVLQHLPNQRHALKRVNDIMKEGGHLVLLVHNKNCLYNPNLRNQRKRGETLALNEYSTIPGVRNLLVESGFKVELVRVCWPSVLHVFFRGTGQKLLSPFLPLRKISVRIGATIGLLLSWCTYLNPAFREIIILAKKPEQ